MNDTVSKVEKIKKHKCDKYYHADDFFYDLSRFFKSRALHKYLKEVSVDSIYPIPRGGMILAVFLSHWYNLPIVPLEEITPSTLIVDDIVDSGKTMKEYINIYPTFALFVNRKVKRNENLCPNFWFNEKADDEWLYFFWEAGYKRALIS